MATNDNNIENKIIETAQQLFVKNGFTDTNMSDIAAAVGINRPTLHYYFRTKDKMFQAVFGNIILSLAPEIQGIMVQDKPISERIGRVVDAYFKIFTDNPSLPIFIVREIERDMPHLISTACALERFWTNAESGGLRFFCGNILQNKNFGLSLHSQKASNGVADNILRK